MKYFKLLLLLVIPIMMGLTSCGGSNDEPDMPSNYPSVVGTWSQTLTQDNAQVTLKFVFTQSNTVTLTMTMKSLSPLYSKEYVYEYTYSYSGDKMTIRTENGAATNLKVVWDGNDHMMLYKEEDGTLYADLRKGAPNDLNEGNDEDVSKNALSGFYQINGMSSAHSKYYFISLNDKNEYALFLGNDIYGSGTFLQNGTTITATSGFNGNVITLSNVNYANDNLSFTINGVNYNAKKDPSKKPISFNGALIGRYYQYKVGSYYAKVSFTNNFGGTDVLTTTKTYTLNVEYVYTGTLLYEKKYVPEGIRQGSVGGWRQDTDIVYINNISLASSGDLTVSLVTDF